MANEQTFHTNNDELNVILACLGERATELLMSKGYLSVSDIVNMAENCNEYTKYWIQSILGPKYYYYYMTGQGNEIGWTCESLSQDIARK